MALPIKKSIAIFIIAAAIPVISIIILSPHKFIITEVYFMFKRVFCVFCSFLILLSLSFTVYAADVGVNCGSHVWDNGVGIDATVLGVGLKCTAYSCTNNCSMNKYSTSFMGLSWEYVNEIPLNATNLSILLAAWIKDTFGDKAQFTPSTDPVTTPPSGYVDQKGTPAVSSSGGMYLGAEHAYTFVKTNDSKVEKSIWVCDHSSQLSSGSFITAATFNCESLNCGARGHFKSQISASGAAVSFGWKFVAPVTGLYKASSPFVLTGFYGSSSAYTYYVTSKFSQPVTDGNVDGVTTYLYSYDSVLCLAGQTYYFQIDGSISHATTIVIDCPQPIISYVPYDIHITNSSNITINNNVWTGNIYQDNSTNLTYIYPQYTTINEQGDTITQISNNPVVYNNETKQYYTYDNTTQNYYYITYVTNPDPTPQPTTAPTPEPSTSPAPLPDPDSPDILAGIALLFADLTANLQLMFDDLVANIKFAIEKLEVNISAGIEEIKLTINNWFGGSGGTDPPTPTPTPSATPIPTATPETSPTPSPDEPPDEPQEGFYVEWLRAVKEAIAGLVQPIASVGGVYTGVFNAIPGEVQVALTGCFALLLLFGVWRFFNG